MGQWWLRRTELEAEMRRFLLFQSGSEVAVVQIPTEGNACSVGLDTGEISFSSVLRAVMLAPGLDRRIRAGVYAVRNFLFECERRGEWVWYVTAKSAKAIQGIRDRRFMTMPAQELVEDFLDSLERRRGRSPSPPEFRAALLEVIHAAAEPKISSSQKARRDAMLATLMPRQLQRYALLKRDLLLHKGELTQSWESEEGAFRAAQRLQQQARARLRKYNRASR